MPEDTAYPAAFSSLGAIAAVTKTIRIGTAVVNPYTRHPVLLGMEMAALDQVSNGRAILGLGGGIRLWIETQMGIPHERPVAAMRDTVAIIRRLFAGEPVEYQGRVFSAGAGIRFDLVPERADLPIYLGATGPKALELAGEVADGILPFFGDPQAVARAGERVRVGAERAGRAAGDIDLGALLFTSVAEDDRAARDAVKPLLATFFGWFATQPDLSLFTDHGLTHADVEVIRDGYARGELHYELVSEAMIDHFTVAGSPERCREKVIRLIEAGVTTAVFSPVTAEGTDVAAHMVWLVDNLIDAFR